MIYTETTPQGNKINLGAPLSVVFNRDEDAPADDFTAIFPCRSGLPSITGIRVTRGNEVIFDGMADEQIFQTASNGCTLKIIARSRAALLLDNEALPQTYIHPSLQTIFDRHAAPYGFTGCIGNPGAFSGEMTVTKGMSEWQVIQYFCAYFLGVSPRVTLDGLLDASGKRPDGQLVFSNTGGGIPYLAFSVGSKYHKLISEIYAQTGKTGAYAIKSADEKSAELGVVRKRYLSASKNGGAYFNAKRMIHTAHRKFREYNVLCLGCVTAELGKQASITDKQFGSFSGLSVAKITYTLGSTGEFSRITLREYE
jgi:hypothetical protein